MYATTEVIGSIDSPPEDNDRTTYFAYDHLDRRTATQEPGGGTTQFQYDKVGNLTKLTDALLNDTSWVFDALDRVITEINKLGFSRQYAYDQVNNLIRLQDRKSQVRTFEYDALYRRTAENWLSGTTEFRGYDFTYNDAGEMLTANDAVIGFASHTFRYDKLGRVKESDVVHWQGGALYANLDQRYDTAGNRIELKAEHQMPGQGAFTPDFVNTYTYDNLSRMIQVQQTGQMGGSEVADKLVDFRYNALSQFTSVDRYKDLAATQLVVGADYEHDILGRLKTLMYSNLPMDPFEWTYDSGSRVTSFNSQDGLNTYQYNKNSELTSASIGSESYAYDANGNRTGGSYNTTLNNQLQSDGVYTYSYDAEGNRATRAKIGTSEIEYYIYDFRNRLEQVLKFNGATPLKFIAYHYDAFDRRIATWTDLTPADGWADAAIERMVYDGTDVILDFLDEDGYGGPEATEQTKRYLHGAAVDQILAQEDFSKLIDAVDRVLWHQADNLGTTRDLARQNGTIATHFSYDSYGNITAGGGSASLTRYLFTGQEFDLNTGLYLYNARWYDPRVGRYVSEDPIGFDAGDANLNRYVGNSPTNATDPTGMAASITILVAEKDRPADFNLGRIEAIVRRALASAGVQAQLNIVSTQRVPADEELGWQYDRYSWFYTMPWGWNFNPVQFCTNIGNYIYYRATRNTLTYRHHVYFGEKVLLNGISYTQNYRTKISPKNIDEQEFTLMRGKLNKDVIYANIIIHEVLYLGLLNSSDDPFDPEGDIESNKVTSQGVIVIPPDYAEEIADDLCAEYTGDE